jgi:hypothetical protein
MNSYIRIAATVFPKDMVYLNNISVDTLHKGDNEDDDDDDDDDEDNDNNNNKSVNSVSCSVVTTGPSFKPV